MDAETIKNIIAIVAAILGLGLVVTVTTKIVINKKKTKKSVKLRQGGVSMREINNNATIDQSEK